jgi:hypothetical protein
MESSIERDQRVMDILTATLAQPAAERQNYLRIACDGISDVSEELADTVEWELRMGDFLQQPLIAFTDFGPPFQPGQIVSERFEIICEIGAGGMGIVYEAFDRKRNQRIAIKSAKPGFQRWLSTELEGALSVRHPNICLVNEIHTAHTEHGEVEFLTMEFLEGETLSAHLSQSGKLTGESALHIARQLCAGLAEAHRSGIINGDLKSANVILCRNLNGAKRAVITDFGLARATTSEACEPAGTPGYMAPELWHGDRLSRASDIYALGVILYEMVTGRRPFPDYSIGQNLSRPVRPSTWTKGLGHKWDSAIMQCLESSPERRTADAMQVLADLEGIRLRKGRLTLVILSLAALAGSTTLMPPVHRKLVELIWPSSVRLAVLPVSGQNETNAFAAGALQEVSDRIREVRGQRRTLVVIPPSEALKNGVKTPEQARQVLHATHALQTTMRRQGNEWIAQGAVVDLETHVHLHDFVGAIQLETRLLCL